MDLHRELVNQANADLGSVMSETSPSKRAWIVGRAMVIFEVANYMQGESPSTQELEAKLATLLARETGALEQRRREGDAQYVVGRVAGLNLVRRLMRRDTPR